MRKVVDSINNGQINRKFGELTFSVNTVEISLQTGSVYEGSFSVFADSLNLAEGYCCSDDYRMEIIAECFSGAQDDIAYRFHAEALEPGTEVRGNFCILSNRGEYSIPFIVKIENDEIESSMGPVRNIFHFANLAKTNWEEAVDMFYDSRFTHLFTGADKELISIYRCLSGVPGSAHNVDEFLVAIRKKTPVEYIPSDKSIEINDPVGMSRFSLHISRNGWGYTHFSIETEGDFLSVADSEVTSEHFLGNSYQAYYYVDADKLHAGKNLGAIIIRDNRFETRIPVQVTASYEGMRFKNMTMFRMKSMVKIMEYYQLYRLKKISARTWFSENTKIVEEMLANDAEDLLARLYQIHLMITQERNNEAVWNLQKVKSQAISIKEEQSYLWCYYLYLCSLLEENAVESRQLAEEVEYCYKLDPNDWRIAWLLSFMSDEYRSVTRRWVMYGEVFSRGCNSPVIYLEAARLVLDNPAIITQLDGFEMQVIRYICKKGMLNDELILCIRSLAEHRREYNPKLLELLEFCYRDNPHDELLMIICSQLINGDRKDAKAFKWYSYAVKQELKITRLYEYYMMSLDKSELCEIPRIVLMYFSFHSDLDYETNAFLYASVVSDRMKDPDMYSRYQMQIDDYVTDQLMAGHNNRYLAILYRNIINDQLLVNEDIAAKVADVIFMYEIDMSEYPDMTSIVLCYDHQEDAEIYPVKDGRVVLPIYSSDYSLAMEDALHNRIMAEHKIQPVQLMPPGRLLLTLQIMLKNHPGIDIHCCLEHRMGTEVRSENEFRFLNLLESGKLSNEFASSITMHLIRFYYEHDREEDLDRFLRNISPEYVSARDKAECIRFLVRRNMYDKAMYWIYKYGPEGIDRVILSDLMYGWLPTHREEENIYQAMIQQLLLMTLDSGRTTRVTMQYLLPKVKGNVQTLKMVWKKACELEVDTRELEENIIVQSLYTGAFVQEKESIIEKYAYQVPDGDILRAALASICYEYYVDEVIVSDRFFRVLTDAFETELELDKVCILAYVKYWAENKDDIDERVKPVLKAALHTLLAQEVVMSSFRELADFMPSMSSYGDATIIEYKAEKHAQVQIHYIIEDKEEYVAENMNEIYGGVYSKMFNLFFGEKLMYYITEGDEDSTDRLLESNSIMKSDTGDSGTQGRYSLVNDICIGRTLRDYESVDELLEEYFCKEYMSTKLFGMYRG